MKLQDLETLFSYEQVEVIVSNPKQFTVNSYLRLRGDEGSTAAFITNVQNDSKTGITLQNVSADFATPHYSKLWAQIQNSNYLAQVVSIDMDRLVIHVVYGFVSKKHTSALEVAVTDRQTRTGNRYALRNAYEVRRHIQEDYVLEAGEIKYICVAKHLKSANDSFALVNGSHAYDVKQLSRRELGVKTSSEGNGESVNEQTSDVLGPEDLIWVINAGERPFNNTTEYSFELWECSLVLKDETTAGKQRAETMAFIQNGLEKYLEVWQKYTEIDYGIIKQLSERAGYLQYSKVQHIIGTSQYQLTLTNPQILENFLNYAKEFGKELKVDVPIDKEDKFGNPVTVIADFTYKPADGNVITVSMDRSPKLGGSVKISAGLADAQYKRRVNALNRIYAGRSAKPDLAMLLSGRMSGSGNSNMLGVRQQKSPLSQAVLGHFGKHKPTEAQATAISIAINTPDFAIIQGPPGTGKSTVIKAIMTALNEKEDDPKLDYGNNLLTAYQRDATSNLSRKFEVYGLPVPTYQGMESDNAVRDQAMTDWIESKARELDESNTDIKELKPVDRLADQVALLSFHFHEDTSTIAEAQTVLEALLYSIDECSDAEKKNYQEGLQKLRNITDEMISNGQTPSLKAPLDLSVYRDDAQRLLDTIMNMRNKDLHVTDRWFAQRLPDSEAMMSDNGMAVAQEIIDRFSSDSYSEKVHKITEKLKELYRISPVPFNMVRVYRDMLMVCVGHIDYPVVDKQINQSLSVMLKGIANHLGNENETDEQRILTDYHSAFDPDNEDLLKEWLSEFMTVIAATHQRAVSSVVSGHKGLSRDNSSDYEGPQVEYENVLIDEAARSCPPDLLIPMACARKRIILVGDQNQLPQFVSETVYEQIEGYEKTELDELIREPLFKRLIEQVKKLEERDHIKRFVRLNEQYRMPKTLGDIVSRCFYEGNGEKILSPLGNDENHTADLPLISGKHLVWLDVPVGYQMKSAENSWYRQSEIDAIIKMLKEMFRNSDNPGKYTYGIITFYKAQMEKLRAAILDDEYLKGQIIKYRIKIHIRTVDAFQGLEEDIMFLSLVRSLPSYNQSKHPYGFTSNANRQCVAISRAKRCLIVVGDKGMVSGARAEQAHKEMPAIAEIYETCANGGVDDACVLKA